MSKALKSTTLEQNSKMDGKSYNPHKEILEFLQKRSPEIFTEGKIDSQKLKQTLGEAIEDSNERYGLSWAGKSDCFRHIQESTTATLKPFRKESIDFDKTENIFIEGDNLQVLKILQKSYYGKVKMIYIDPPYNTGNDSFIYPDRFQETQEEYLQRIGDKDEEGNLLRDGMFQKNSRDNGHFHSNWLSMMYPRLFLARNLLRDDGVIFVSIDDNEAHNLRAIMNEIFGEENFLSSIVWEKRFTRSNNAKLFATLTESILCYRKTSLLETLKEPRGEKANSIYDNPDNDPRGVWTSVSYVNPATKKQRPNLVYPIRNPFTNKKVEHPTNAWKYEYEVHEKFVQENKLYWGKEGKNTYPRLKLFLSEMDGGMVPVNFWNRNETGTTDEGSKELESLLGGKYFDFPKPNTLIKRALKIGMDKDDIILDFFSGTSPTAHAVFEANKEDNGNRKFILVQLPEPCPKESEAYNKGYKTIADIGKERIRKLGKALSKLNKDLNVGFKSFGLSESNFKIWRSDFKSGKELEKQLEMFVDNVHKESTQENILYELILKSGLDLNVNIHNKEWQKSKFFSVDNGNLVVILEDKISKDFIGHIISLKPQKVITLDRAFADNDQLKTNIHLQMESAKIDFKVI